MLVAIHIYIFLLSVHYKINRNREKNISPNQHWFDQNLEKLWMTEKTKKIY